MKFSIAEAKSYLIITLGLCIYSFGWTAFLIPSEIVAGGVGGIGTIIYYASGETIPVGYSFFVINIFLILIALKVLGSRFGIKTIFGIIVGSVLLYFQQQWITEPLVDEKFMASIIGGILAGVGIGITLTQGGSTGGTDIVAMMINKYRNIGPGRVILYIDIFIIASSYIIFEDISTIVYGYVEMGVAAYTIDMMISGSKQSAQLFIMSTKYEEVAEMLSEETGRGISMLHSTGWYTRKDTMMLMIVVRKHETQYIFRVVKELDPKAFITMGSVMGVFGEGFEEIRA
ncbi:YitT family protein [Labilibaculum sp. DW002]|uniref:YitT family protein n=1 Tax=Paralabilibaculum antarcticum TaxID=2912572 RepID=A0ABT5VXM1_9BACT|nr:MULTISPECIES: YitT family protein [unclassified Labilibaculum]MBI9059549.1 YitT family protein [Labilibaculum sp.]MDE5420171.1 YitT family protein [Labilibaculum sp. DW002]